MNAEQQIINRTKFKLDQIAAFKLLAIGKSMWRQRDLKIYQHPDDDDKVISVGVGFNNQGITVVAVELKEEWKRELSMSQPFITR